MLNLFSYSKPSDFSLWNLEHPPFSPDFFSEFEILNENQP